MISHSLNPVTDMEMAAYAEGTLSPDERRDVERRALACGQSSLLLHSIFTVNAVTPSAAAVSADEERVKDNVSAGNLATNRRQSSAISDAPAAKEDEEA